MADDGARAKVKRKLSQKEDSGGKALKVGVDGAVGSRGTAKQVDSPTVTSPRSYDESNLRMKVVQTLCDADVFD